MIEDLKPYPEYKDSGLPWLGEVPAHWEVRPAAGAFKPIRERNTGMKEKTVLSLSYGRIVVKPAERLHGLVPESFETYQIVNPGDIVIRTTDLQNDKTSLRTGFVRDSGIITSAYLALSASAGVLPEFGYQFLNTWDISKAIYGYGSGLRQNLDFSDFRRMPVSVPPIAEQAAIARFLAWATSRLDRAIGAKRRIIALLQEQKQAIIHRAVTRGLDPSAPLKDSGIPWLGEIPEHWEVMPVKRTCSLVRDGTHLPPARTQAGFPLLSVRNMVGGQLVRRPDDSFISRADFDKLNRSFAVNTNDVLMAVVGATLGKVAIVEDIGPFQVQRSVCVLRTRLEIMSHTFLATFLRSPRLQQHLWKSVAFSAQPGIYLGFVANIPVPVPPTIQEQVAICDGLQREQSPVGTAITRLEHEITLLREYRTRLIADVVTGKLDVRQVAAGLPVEIEPSIQSDAAGYDGDDAEDDPGPDPIDTEED